MASIFGTGALTFSATAAMTTQEGFILTGSNTFTGPMTIAPNGTVAVGEDSVIHGSVAADRLNVSGDGFITQP